MNYALVVVGASLGGLRSLKAVLSALPQGYALPIAVVQHRTPEAGDSLEFVLQDDCAVALREAMDKMPIEAGNVYLAPAGYHLLVEGDHFALTTEDPVCFARPSIDVLFDTAAESFGSRLIGVVLTGTGRDGSEGAAAIARAGGLIVVENPHTAEEAEMPQAALDAMHGAVVLGIGEIGPYLAKLGRA